MKTKREPFWASEPFRVFFPLGVGFGLIGVSHWLWYHAGLIETYSCHYHGLVQIQCFEASFVVGHKTLPIRYKVKRTA